MITFKKISIVRLLLFSLVVALCFTSCDKEDTKPEKDTVEYFQMHLKADMNLATLKETFGEPDGDKGSGIHIYVYKLNDGTEIWIGFSDKIHYARHMDSNGQLIANII